MRRTCSRPNKHPTKNKFIAVVFSLPLRSGGHLTFTKEDKCSSAHTNAPTVERQLHRVNDGFGKRSTSRRSLPMARGITAITPISLTERKSAAGKNTKWNRKLLGRLR